MALRHGQQFEPVLHVARMSAAMARRRFSSIEPRIGSGLLGRRSSQAIAMAGAAKRAPWGEGGAGFSDHEAAERTRSSGAAGEIERRSVTRSDTSIWFVTSGTESRDCRD